MRKSPHRIILIGIEYILIDEDKNQNGRFQSDFLNSRVVIAYAFLLNNWGLNTIIGSYEGIELQITKHERRPDSNSSNYIFSNFQICF